VGQGPPGGAEGWIKTGHMYPETSGSPGYPNCNHWTSSDDAHRGTVARLPIDYSDPASSVWALVWGTPWAAITKACDVQYRVWCVED
jgi:hypothetical protein